MLNDHCYDQGRNIMSARKGLLKFQVEGSDKVSYILGWPKTSLGFFVRCYGKTQMNLLANPIYVWGKSTLGRENRN